MKKTLKLLLLLCTIPSFLYSQRTFVHPGCSHKKSDLDRMRYMVAAGLEPWKSSYTKLVADSKSSYNYVVRGNTSMTVITQDGTNYSAFSSDVKAAYLNALMWSVNGDARHAAKAVEIFNAWVNITEFTGGGTESLNAGRVIWQFMEAAEIIKSTYPGWTVADIQKFKDMLVYPGYSDVAKPASVTNTNGTFYWRMYNGDPGRHGNQDLFGWRGVMAIGIFMDNEKMYDRSLRYIKGLPARIDDIPYQTGPPVVSANPVSSNVYFDTYTLSGYNNTIANYGYNGVLANYIWENGQCQESSRDQDHGILGVGMLASIAEMAWNQGDDLYSLLNRRILKGYEFSMRYNVSYANHYPDQPAPWEPTVESGEFIQRRDRSGRWFSKKINPYKESDFVTVSRGTFLADKRPIHELAIAHYQRRIGLPDDSLKWTIRAYNRSMDSVGNEGNGWSLDHLGWGGLTCHRPKGCPGDPCTFESGKPVFGMNLFPGTLEAANFDYFPSGGEGFTYHDLSPANTTGKYRINEGVDIDTCSEGGYCLSEMEPGEWLSYSVYFPVTFNYRIAMRYSASDNNGRIKLVLNETDTVDAAVPFGGSYSTGLQDWKDFIIISHVLIARGVKSLKILVEGSEKAFNLKSILMKYEQIITFGALSSKKVTDPDFSLSGTSNAWLPIQYVSSDTTVATIIDQKIHIKAAGSTTITALQSGNNLWAAADSVSQVLTVTDVNAVPEITGSSMIIMPNPAGSRLTVQLPVISNKATMSIFNITGQRVIEIAHLSETNELDISRLSSGIYFLRLICDGHIISRKIIKE